MMPTRKMPRGRCSLSGGGGGPVEAEAEAEAAGLRPLVRAVEPVAAEPGPGPAFSSSSCSALTRPPEASGWGPSL